MRRSRSWGPMCRVLYRLLVSLARLAVHSGDSKDLEIIVLRHQLTVGHRQNNRPAIAEKDRAVLGAISAGHCWPCPDRSELAGSSHSTPCCAGTDTASPPLDPTHPTSRPPAHHRREPPTRAPNGPREPDMGLPPHHRRTHRARPTDWSIDSGRILKQHGFDPAPPRGVPSLLCVKRLGVVGWECCGRRRGVLGRWRWRVGV